MSPPHTNLRDLLDKALEKHDAKSINKLADIVQSAGYTTTQTTLNGVYNGTYRSKPKRPTLEAIAYLAGVTLEQAYAAADMDRPGEPFNAAPGADKLTPKERDIVNSVIRGLLEARELGRSSDDPKVEENSGRRVAFIHKNDYTYPNELPRSDEAT